MNAYLISAALALAPPSETASTTATTDTPNERVVARHTSSGYVVDHDMTLTSTHEALVLLHARVGDDLRTVGYAKVSARSSSLPGAPIQLVPYILLDDCVGKPLLVTPLSESIHGNRFAAHVTRVAVVDDANMATLDAGSDVGLRKGDTFSLSPQYTKPNEQVVGPYVVISTSSPQSSEAWVNNGEVQVGNTVFLLEGSPHGRIQCDGVRSAPSTITPPKPSLDIALSLTNFSVDYTPRNARALFGAGLLSAAGAGIAVFFASSFHSQGEQKNLEYDAAHPAELQRVYKEGHRTRVLEGTMIATASTAATTSIVLIGAAILCRNGKLSGCRGLRGRN